MPKPNLNCVHRPTVEAIYDGLNGDPKKRGGAFSDYIVRHFRSTGNLAPGCDARDFFAVWDQIAAERAAEAKA